MPVLGGIAFSGSIKSDSQLAMISTGTEIATTTRAILVKRVFIVFTFSSIENVNFIYFLTCVRI